MSGWLYQLKHLGAAVITLASCAIGAGLVSLPFAFQHAGLVASTVVLLLTAVLNIGSLYLVTCAGDMTNAKSYGQLALAYGPKWRVVMEGILAVVLLGVTISLQIIITDTFRQIIDTLANYSDGERNHIAIGCMGAFNVLVIIPLSSLRNITWLSASGALSVGSFLYLVFWLVIQGSEHVESDDISKRSRTHTVGFDFWSIIDVAPIIVYSLGCQVQAVALYHELPKEFRRPPRFLKLVCVPATILCLILYISTGSLGMFAVNQSSPLSGDILSDLPVHDASATVVQFAVAISLITVSPVIVWPIRESIMEIIESCRHHDRTGRHSSDSDDIPEPADCQQANDDVALNGLDHIQSSPLLRPSYEAGSAMAVTASLRDDHPTEFVKRLLKESILARAILSTIIVGIAFSVSVLVHSVTTVFRFVGAVGASFLFYVYPAGVILRMQHNVGVNPEEQELLSSKADSQGDEKDSLNSPYHGEDSDGTEEVYNPKSTPYSAYSATSTPQANGNDQNNPVECTDNGDKSIHDVGNSSWLAEDAQRTDVVKHLRSYSLCAMSIAVLVLGVVVGGLSTYSVIITS
eukprot:gb/GECG01001670.1/.p1 GENE.gb/GECG01001670.1/~~gb/GECG01001670.1/.p1  ORF type:complete len:577 (+),score=40.88 gb/GECG01001670.1/:1-1731(+)